MNRQKGLSLVGLIMIGILVALAAMVVMKVTPSVIEYYTVLKNINAVVKSGEASGTVADIRRAYERRTAVDETPSVQAKDLEISKYGGQVVISFAYEKKIPLFGNASLCIDYQGSTNPSATKSID